MLGHKKDRKPQWWNKTFDFEGVAKPANISKTGRPLGLHASARPRANVYTIQIPYVTMTVTVAVAVAATATVAVAVTTVKFLLILS